MATPRFPEPQDAYPVIYLKETDKSLSSNARMQNNTRYAYFKTIARGGKCLIQTCKDLHLGRVVCYKTLHSEIADDPLEQQRFLREARVTAMLQHPNTVPVYELGRDTSGHYYFTMKRVQGDTLLEILDLLRAGDKQATRHWGMEEFVDLLIQVGQALDYAHTHGVIHRDIKPANILVGSFGEVLLLDWGLAKVWDMAPESRPGPNSTSDIDDPSLTAKGPLQATPLYMSPEQVRGAVDIDHRTDIYSFGAILFEMLTLQHLAWGETIDEMLSNIETRSTPTPSLVSPNRMIPTRLESVCMRCIAKDPSQRFQTVRELIVELLYWQRVKAAARPIP